MRLLTYYVGVFVDSLIDGLPYSIVVGTILYVVFRVLGC